MTKYIFDEDSYLNEIQSYIDETYKQHYASDGRQTMEVIFENGFGEGFNLGACEKYIKRYANGKKGGKQRKDLLKLIHCSILALINHDRQNCKEKYSYEAIKQQRIEADCKKYTCELSDEVVGDTILYGREKPIPEMSENLSEFLDKEEKKKGK